MVIVALNSSIDDESYNRYHSTALLELMHISKSKNILFHTSSALNNFAENSKSAVL
jgi:hypothetical protein